MPASSATLNFCTLAEPQKAEISKGEWIAVHQLGMRRAGPAWRNPVGGSLDGELAQAS
jgi:hypothetical protein